jgi:hypothetical protein
MIKEDYVSFEAAKLLKEKGFDESCRAVYEEKVLRINTLCDYHNSELSSYVCAPTIQMAMKWLREVYHIEIYITFGFPFIDDKQQYKYFWSIVKVCDNHLEYPMDDPGSASYNEEMADSYEDAVEAALKYTFENLI